MIRKLLIAGLLACCGILAFTCHSDAAKPDFSAVNAGKYYRIIYGHICQTNSAIGKPAADMIARKLLDSCYTNNVAPLLVTAVYTQESGFNPRSVSGAGARGIAQIMPETARMLKIDNNDAAQNIDGGVRYLAQLLNTFATAGDWQMSYAVAAYNAGPGAITKYGGIPPYPETQSYVRCVGEIYKRLVQAMANS